MNVSVAEVLKKAGSFKDVAQRAKHLKDNETKALKAVIYFTYAKEVKWLIPETDPPYKASTPEQDLQNVLKSTYNRLRIYVEGGGWTGHDHINDPTTVPQLSLQEGYVCVVIHHRPIRFNPGPLCALLLAALFVSFDVLSFSFYTLLALSAATALLIEIAVNRFFHTDPSNMANVVNDVARTKIIIIIIQT